MPLGLRIWWSFVTEVNPTIKAEATGTNSMKVANRKEKLDSVTSKKYLQSFMSVLYSRRYSYRKLKQTNWSWCIFEDVAGMGALSNLK